MRSILLGAVVGLTLSAASASAQAPVVTVDTYKMNAPGGQPWGHGGYDPRLGYWVHGGDPDTPSAMWAVRAYTPVNANGYWLSQPPNTGFVMAYPAAPAGVAAPAAAPATGCRLFHHKR
jgi:hypothetical protein